MAFSSVLATRGALASAATTPSSSSTTATRRSFGASRRRARAALRLRRDGRASSSFASIAPRASASEDAVDAASDASDRASDPTWGWGGRDEEGSRSRVARALASAAAASTVALSLASPSLAAFIDPRAAETGKCLLSSCQLELAGCIADEKCAESLVCLQTCFGRPDEADCQIKCGDLYASKAVQTFNTCAVTNKNCVKQKQDTGEYPVPPLDAMASGFDANVFAKDKRWYIVAGLNKDFDTFDCQEHFFSATDPDHMAVKINWRVNRPNGQFYERSDVQTFYADDRTKSILHNNVNEYLHYQDDWYIPGYKEGEYVFVYYKGTNDAWDGYGGAVVYSTKPELDPAYVPELTAIGKKVGVKFSDFVVTDNSCKPEPELKLSKIADLDTLADDAYVIEKDIAKDFGIVGKDARKFAGIVGKDARLLERELEKDVKSIESEIEKDVTYEANAVKAEVRALEDQLVSFGSRFTFIKPPDMVGDGRSKEQAREIKKAEKALASVEKSVRREDARQ
ncbi:violaxanthin deepoxidase [Micromonas pusilla CCMP1545]|uniref:Violaxanthin deepoxidase n=1 Tax=Micromonas pusilla (strain CCMP1545) TaxID=564608 RepID=C1MYZ1_MICPC|nr:violaxanthin deepoxidase [Micromonas pusilla CCMP1545]EEH54773.1 violaxanthin deepoxidase [Micromonas pusilla CCMP1545]|eukprot:XP_003061123.1 violaxanthin deepoxidase [Micromonas pusilla CCMP1545]